MTNLKLGCTDLLKLAEWLVCYDPFQPPPPPPLLHSFVTSTSCSTMFVVVVVVVVVVPVDSYSFDISVQSLAHSQQYC